MNEDMKPSITIELTQEDFILLQKALEEKEHKHMSCYKRISGSGYGKTSTEVKAKEHKYLAEDCANLVSKIANEFI